MYLKLLQADTEDDSRKLETAYSRWKSYTLIPFSSVLEQDAVNIKVGG